MSRILKILIVLAILVGIGVVIFWQFSKPSQIQQTPETETPPQEEQLKIIKTNPDPLEGATILPTQSIEITFNKVIPRSEFKHLLDPEIKNYEVESVGGDSTKGPTIRINFKEPLQLGVGYSLTIYQHTRSEKEEDKLDKEYLYHFKTIQYKGV
jgi:hypothetical protein